MENVYRRTAEDLGKSEILKQGQMRLRVNSQSMAPVLQVGDHILLQPASADTLHRGDIVVIQQLDGYLTHRLIGQGAQGLSTKGDRNRLADAPIQANHIIGVVISLERDGHSVDLSTGPLPRLAKLMGWLGRKETASGNNLVTFLMRLIERMVSVLIWMWEH